MRAEIMELPGVVANWTERDKVVIGVKTKADADALKVPVRIVPSKIDRLPTEVRVVGEITIRQERTDKWRPAPGGVSIGHFSITAGTLGGVYRDAETGELVILSNNHVLANSNAGKAGDDIYQPGPYDIEPPPQPPIPPIPPCPWANLAAKLPNLGAHLMRSRWRLVPRLAIDPEEYRIARLLDFHPIDFSGGVNYIDAAVAMPVEPDIVKTEILELGVPTGFVEADLGMEVIKSGRTTGVTDAVVQAIDGTIRVSYGNGLEALFDEQIITGKLFEGGDSGSNVLEKATKRLAGLGFAGSNTISVTSPIKRVLDWRPFVMPS